MATTKKQNFFVRYFQNFGLKQICDIAMILGAIVLLVGLFVAIGNLTAATVLLIIGFSIYALAGGGAIYLSVKVLLSKINRRSPEYKRAIVNTVVMGVLFALSVFGLIWAIVV